MHIVSLILIYIFAGKSIYNFVVLIAIVNFPKKASGYIKALVLLIVRK